MLHAISLGTILTATHTRKGNGNESLRQTSTRKKRKKSEKGKEKKERLKKIQKEKKRKAKERKDWLNG